MKVGIVYATWNLIAEVSALAKKSGYEPYREVFKLLNSDLGNFFGAKGAEERLPPMAQMCHYQAILSLLPSDFVTIISGNNAYC